jgi:hypothetical protein
VTPNHGLGTAALTVYYALFIVILMNGRLLLTEHAVFVTCENIAMQLAIAAGGLITYATARIDAAQAMNHTASLVPKWLPPAQEFWGYATGVGFVGGIRGADTIRGCWTGASNGVWSPDLCHSGTLVADSTVAVRRLA